MIEMKDMSYSIPYKMTILKDVNLEIREGEYIGVLGRNGAGKTTLLDLFMGLRQPTKGILKVMGFSPFQDSREHFKHVTYISQEVTAKEDLTVEQFLRFNQFFYPNYSTDEEGQLLKLFSLDKSERIGALSLGQKRRVHIVAALASMPKLLLIDEITAVLDPEARHLFFNILEKYNKERKTTIVLATNITDDLKGRVQSLLYVDRGIIVRHPHTKIDELFLGAQS